MLGAVSDDHRTTLRVGSEQAQDSYDKAVMSIAAGALGIALGFIKPQGQPVWKGLFLFACACFILSLIAVLYSFWCSRKSFDKELADHDSKTRESYARLEGVEKAEDACGRPGGGYARVTEFLNVSAGCTLVAGLAALSVFVVKNLGEVNMPERPPTSPPGKIDKGRLPPPPPPSPSTPISQPNPPKK
jgi:hypothetical protein